MKKYLLDSNIVIGLWNKHAFFIEKLFDGKKIEILKEVSDELVVKEMKEYKGQYVLSDRFCRLLPFIIEIDKENMEEFYNMLNIKYSKKGNAYFEKINKLSENDLKLLYACYLDNKLILVTEDKYLFNAASQILGMNRVMTLNMLLENE